MGSPFDLTQGFYTAIRSGSQTFSACTSPRLAEPTVVIINVDITNTDKLERLFSNSEELVEQTAMDQEAVCRLRAVKEEMNIKKCNVIPFCISETTPREACNTLFKACLDNTLMRIIGVIVIIDSIDVAMGRCTSTSNVIVMNRGDVTEKNLSPLFTAGLNTNILFPVCEGSVLNIMMGYCLMFDMFCSTEYPKLFIAPFAHTKKCLTKRSAMIMRHQFVSVFVLHDDNMAPDAISFLMEMGRIYPPKPNIEHKCGRYRPMENTPTAGKMLNVVQRNDNRLPANVNNYSPVHLAMHHKKKGATSCISVMDVDLSKVPVFTVFVSNMKSDTGALLNYNTNSVAFSLMSGLSHVMHLGSPGVPNNEHIITVLSSFSFNDKLPTLITLYFHINLSYISLVITSRDGEILKTLLVKYVETNFFPTDRAYNVPEISGGWLSSKEGYENPVSFFVMKTFADTMYEMDHGSPELTYEVSSMSAKKDVRGQSEGVVMIGTGTLSSSPFDSSKMKMGPRPETAVSTLAQTVTVLLDESRLRSASKESVNDTYIEGVSAAVSRWHRAFNSDNLKDEITQLSQSLGVLSEDDSPAKSKMWGNETYTHMFETNEMPEGFVLNPSLGPHRAGLFIGTSQTVLIPNSGARGMGISGVIFEGIYVEEAGMGVIIIIATVIPSQRTFHIGQFASDSPSNVAIVFNFIGKDLWYSIDPFAGSFTKYGGIMVSEDAIKEPNYYRISNFLNTLMQNDDNGHTFTSGVFVPIVPNAGEKNVFTTPPYFFGNSLAQHGFIRTTLGETGTTVIARAPDIIRLGNGVASRFRVSTQNGEIESSWFV